MEIEEGRVGRIGRIVARVRNDEKGKLTVTNVLYLCLCLYMYLYLCLCFGGGSRDSEKCVCVWERGPRGGIEGAATCIYIIIYIYMSQTNIDVPHMHNSFVDRV